MITPILITAMICTTLIVIFKSGIKIDIKRDLEYKDTTSYQTTPKDDTKISYKDKEPKEIEDFVNDTMTTLNEYLADGEDDKHGTRSKV